MSTNSSLKAWDRQRLNRKIKAEPDLAKEKVLENLMYFLCHEVEGEEYHVSAENVFGSGIKRKEFHKPVHRDVPTAATLIMNTTTGKVTCIFCNSPHPIKNSLKMSIVS
ncbi:transposable element Tc1 transposase [Nephila pilipes]|uniref:Transposable element Tc1 transposase n=1 Tax=Nephila pilipes TaxID=299642 RepID=A0A8X6UBH1_NEPPI|nr:transposable element Tc1 transposase [Nephila pilipes]